MLARWLFLVLCLGWASVAAPALGSTPGAIAPLGARLRAGSTVELAWSELPAATEELEVLLSVDGGQSFPLRVSPELDGRERTFRWRVPSLATFEAKLRIRGRLHGREVEFAPSESFAIEIAAESREAPRHFNEGGWWNGPLERAAGAHEAIGAPRPALASAGPTHEVTLPTRTWMTARSEPVRELSPSVCITAAQPHAPSRSSSPSFVPPRE